MDEIVRECYSRFLVSELRECRNARYLFTLGKDNFAILSELLETKGPALLEFRSFYGIKREIPAAVLGRTCYLVLLPHQPTYDLAERHSPYSREEVRKRLNSLD